MYSSSTVTRYNNITDFIFCVFVKYGHKIQQYHILHLLCIRQVRSQDTTISHTSSSVYSSSTVTRYNNMTYVIFCVFVKYGHKIQQYHRLHLLCIRQVRSQGTTISHTSSSVYSLSTVTRYNNITYFIFCVFVKYGHKIQQYHILHLLCIRQVRSQDTTIPHTSSSVYSSSTVTRYNNITYFIFCVFVTVRSQGTTISHTSSSVYSSITVTRYNNITYFIFCVFVKYGSQDTTISHTSSSVYSSSTVTRYNNITDFIFCVFVKYGHKIQQYHILHLLCIRQVRSQDTTISHTSSSVYLSITVTRYNNITDFIFCVFVKYGHKIQQYHILHLLCIRQVRSQDTTMAHTSSSVYSSSTVTRYNNITYFIFCVFVKYGHKIQQYHILHLLCIRQVRSQDTTISHTSSSVYSSSTVTRYNNITYFIFCVFVKYGHKIQQYHILHLLCIRQVRSQDTTISHTSSSVYSSSTVTRYNNITYFIFCVFVKYGHKIQQYHILHLLCIRQVRSQDTTISHTSSSVYSSSTVTRYNNITYFIFCVFVKYGHKIQQYHILHLLCIRQVRSQDTTISHTSSSVYSSSTVTRYNDITYFIFCVFVKYGHKIQQYHILHLLCIRQVRSQDTTISHTSSSVYSSSTVTSYNNITYFIFCVFVKYGHKIQQYHILHLLCIRQVRSQDTTTSHTSSSVYSSSTVTRYNNITYFIFCVFVKYGHKIQQYHILHLLCIRQVRSQDTTISHTSSSVYSPSTVTRYNNITYVIFCVFVKYGHKIQQYHILHLLCIRQVRSQDTTISHTSSSVYSPSTVTRYNNITYFIFCVFVKYGHKIQQYHILHLLCIRQVRSQDTTISHTSSSVYSPSTVTRYNNITYFIFCVFAKYGHKIQQYHIRHLLCIRQVRSQDTTISHTSSSVYSSSTVTRYNNITYFIFCVFVKYGHKIQQYHILHLLCIRQVRSQDTTISQTSSSVYSSSTVTRYNNITYFIFCVFVKYGHKIQQHHILHLLCIRQVFAYVNL